MAFSRKDEQFRRYALTEKPLRVIFTACLPLALYQALQQIFKILDALMASHIGADAVSAVSCLSQITLMITALGSGLAVGGSIQISESYGRGDETKVRQQTANVYMLAIAVSILVAATLIPFAQPFLRLLKTPEDLITAGAGYFRVEVLSLVVSFFNTVYIAIERSRGHGKKILFLNLAIILVKLGLSALFVYALDGGLILVAVATLLSQLLVLAYAVCTMPKDEGAFRFSIRNVRLAGSLLAPLADLSIPVAAEKMLFASGKVIVNSMSGVYGALTVGALGISNNIGGLTTSWHLGFTDGASALISQNRGAGKYRRTLRLYGWLLTVDVLIGGMGLALVSWALPWLAGIFAQSKGAFDPVFRDMIVSIHRWEMLGYITLGIHSATMALLMGYGKTKQTMLLNVSRVFVFRVPVLWALQRFTGFGPEATGITMMVSNICTGLAAILMALPLVIEIRRKAKEEEI